MKGFSAWTVRGERWNEQSTLTAKCRWLRSMMRFWTWRVCHPLLCYSDSVTVHEWGGFCWPDKHCRKR